MIRQADNNVDLEINKEVPTNEASELPAAKLAEVAVTTVNPVKKNLTKKNTNVTFNPVTEVISVEETSLPAMSEEAVKPTARYSRSGRAIKTPIWISMVLAVSFMSVNADAYTQTAMTAMETTCISTTSQLREGMNTTTTSVRLIRQDVTTTANALPRELKVYGALVLKVKVNNVRVALALGWMAMMVGLCCTTRKRGDHNCVRIGLALGWIGVMTWGLTHAIPIDNDRTIKTTTTESELDTATATAMSLNDPEESQESYRFAEANPEDIDLTKVVHRALIGEWAAYQQGREVLRIKPRPIVEHWCRRQDAERIERAHPFSLRFTLPWNIRSILKGVNGSEYMPEGLSYEAACTLRARQQVLSLMWPIYGSLYEDCAREHPGETIVGCVLNATLLSEARKQSMRLIGGLVRSQQCLPG